MNRRTRTVFVAILAVTLAIAWVTAGFMFTHWHNDPLPIETPGSMSR